VRAPDGIPVVFGAAISNALEQAMPMARLQFLPEGHGDVSALREGGIDLDIGAFRGRHPEIEIDLVASHRLVGAVRAKHPLARLNVTAKRYAAERHVAVNLRQGETSTVDEALESAGYARFIALQVPSAYAALTAAVRSNLVATVTEPTARAMQAGLGLHLFNLPFAVPAEPTVMAWHPRHGADVAHQWLRTCVKQVFADPKWIPPPIKGHA